MAYTSNNEAKKFTKECVAQAFLQLLREKEYDDITITEIAEKAGVSRNAVYRNFKSKEMILKVYLMDMTIGYMENHKISELDTYEAHVMHLFGYLCDNVELSKIIIKSGLAHYMLDAFALVRGYTKASFTPEHYYESYRMGGIFATYLTWIFGGCKETKEELTEIVCNIDKEKSIVPDFERKDR